MTDAQEVRPGDPRRVLLISYYFPPSGGPGVQRPLKFARYLGEFGFDPVVLTVEEGSFPDRDETLLAEVPEDLEVIRARSWDPYQIYARWTGKDEDSAVSVGYADAERDEVGWREWCARWVRANVFLPDARVGWVPFAAQRGSRYLREQPVDLLWTTGPPHSTHLVGRSLKARFDVPWVADFRDPWTESSYYEKAPRTGLAEWWDRRREISVLEAADGVVAASDGFGRLLKEKTTLDRYATIPNGFDPEDVPERASSDEGDEVGDARFRIAHVGTLPELRRTSGLEEALGRRVAEEADWRDALEVRLVGRVDGSIVEGFRRAGLEEQLSLIPYLPHEEAVREMQAADLALAVVEDVPANAGIIPAKIFEYMATGRRVLGIGDPEGDMAGILREAGAGQVFDYRDTEGIGRFLDTEFERVRQGDPPPPLDEEYLRTFRRRALTRRLAEFFETVLSAEPTRASA